MRPAPWRRAPSGPNAAELLSDGAVGVGYLLEDRVADPRELVEGLGLRPSGADHRRVLAVLAWLSDAGGARPTG